MKSNLLTDNDPTLEILYQDEWLVAINKPNGLLVHRSRIAADAKTFALQLLRDQIGQRVNPVHRLDRKTSGVLLFTLDGSITKNLQEQFQQQEVTKKYIAIVRGYFPKTLDCDHPLVNENGMEQAAKTNFKLIKKTELPIPFGRYATARYSLIEATPLTGRMHQIRKHLNHLRHPIIGDRPHGCNKQNRLFKERWNMNTLLLHAKSLAFSHPVTAEQIVVEASIPEAFERMIEELHF